MMHLVLTPCRPTGKGKSYAYVLRSGLPECLRKHCPRPARLAQHQHALAVILFRLINLTGNGMLPEGGAGSCTVLARSLSPAAPPETPALLQTRCGGF